LSHTLPLGKAARATRAVSSGTGAISIGCSDIEASTGYFPDTITWVFHTFAPTALQIEALTEFASSISFGESI
jgi:hypothetical protein